MTSPEFPGTLRGQSSNHSQGRGQSFLVPGQGLSCAQVQAYSGGAISFRAINPRRGSQPSSLATGYGTGELEQVTDQSFFKEAALATLGQRVRTRPLISEEAHP